MHLYFPGHIESGNFRFLRTPIAIGRKGDKLVDWVFDFEEIKNMNESLKISYVKGLGSWSKKDLQHIIEKEGLDSLIPSVDVDDKEFLENWFISEKSDWRKERILETESFDIMKV